MKYDTISILANEKVSKALLKLCIPAVVAMTINGIYNVVDAFFIGLTGDLGAIGAISVIFPLFLVTAALGIGVSVGVSSFMSRCLGAGEKPKAQKAAGAALIIAALIGLLVTAAGFIWMKPLLYLFGARDTILNAAVSYTSWILPGSIFVIINSTLAGTIRAEGNTLYSTIAVLAGTILNIILDPVFIFIFHMGISGAAIATLISYIVTFIISIFYYTRKKAAIKLNISIKSLDRENTTEIVKIGVPAMLKEFLLAVVLCTINYMAAQYGEAAVTAAGICAKINSFVAMTLLGITQGFMPLAAFNYGARNFKRVLKGLKIVFITEIGFSIFSMLLYLIFAQEIVAIFCNDAEVIKVGQQFLYGFAVGMIPTAIAFLMDTLFFASGMGKSALLLTTSRQGFVFFPVIFACNALFGLTGIAWTQMASDILCCIFISLPLYLSYIKKTRTNLVPEMIETSM